MKFRRLTYGILLLLFIGKASLAFSQLSVQFVPAIYGQNVQSLAFAQIVNTSSFPIKVSVLIKVKEKNAGEILRIHTASFFLRKGSNTIDRLAFSNATFYFASNDFGNLIKQSGKFPEGEYEYCFEINVEETKDPNILPSYEQCFIYQVQPLTPLLLIIPADADQICNKRPEFVWQPPMPLPIDARFRVIVSEMVDKQEPIEAITYNTPIINQAEIFVNRLPYPVNIVELKEGHKYAWQVTVYSHKAILKKSDIWVFTIKCADQIKEVNTDSYRDLKDVDDGNFYIAKNFLHFSLNNPYSAGNLSYSIECLSDPNISVKNLPKLPIVPGLNKYDVDLTSNNSFVDDNEYLLKVILANGKQLKLRFIYKSESK